MSPSDITKFRVMCRKKQFWRIMTDDEIHHGFQYKDGLNIDILPFNPSGSCAPGGLYFTTLDDLFYFLKTYEGCHFREVIIPEDAQIYQEGWKWKADKLILGKRYDFSLETLLFFKVQGVYISGFSQRLLYRAARGGNLDIVKYITQNYHLFDHNINEAIYCADAEKNNDIVDYLKIIIHKFNET